MIEAQEAQNRGMQVMDMNLVHRRVETEIIRLTQRHARTDTPAGQPHRETIRMMITTIISALHHRRPTKLASPNHQSVFEQTPGLEVLNQSRISPIRVHAVALQIA